MASEQTPELTEMERVMRAEDPGVHRIEDGLFVCSVDDLFDVDIR